MNEPWEEQTPLPWLEWIAKHEPMAYEVLGLTPWEFGRLTIAQFRLMVSAADRRWEHEQEERARMLRWLISCWVKRTDVPSIDKILGRPFQPQGSRSGQEPKG